MEDNSYELFCGTDEFIMIFMALSFVLENYFDVLSLMDWSSDICDEILGCWMLLFNIFFMDYLDWIDFYYLWFWGVTDDVAQ